MTLNSLLTDGPYSFAYLKKLIVFSMTILFFQTSTKITVSENLKNYLVSVVYVVCVLFICMYLIDTSQMYYFQGQKTRYLTFRFSNPNITALFLTCFDLLLIIEFTKEKKVILKWAKGLMASIFFVFILETQSRNALIVVSIFVMVLFLVLKRKKQFNLNMILSLLFSAWPLLFSALYMLLVYNDKILTLFSFMVEKGKQLDSRAKMWEKAFERVRTSPIIGAYNQASKGTGQYQFHNTHLDIMAYYGIIVLILVIIFLFRIIYKKKATTENKEKFFFVLAFCFTIAMGMGEAAVFSGGLGIYIFSGMFLYLANDG